MSCSSKANDILNKNAPETGVPALIASPPSRKLPAWVGELPAGVEVGYAPAFQDRPYLTFDCTGSAQAFFEAQGATQFEWVPGEATLYIYRQGEGGLESLSLDARSRGGFRLSETNVMMGWDRRPTLPVKPQPITGLAEQDRAYRAEIERVPAGAVVRQEEGYADSLYFAEASDLVVYLKTQGATQVNWDTKDWVGSACRPHPYRPGRLQEMRFYVDKKKSGLTISRLPNWSYTANLMASYFYPDIDELPKLESCHRAKQSKS